MNTLPKRDQPVPDQLVLDIRKYAEEGWSKKDIAELTGQKYRRILYLADKNNIEARGGKRKGIRRRLDIDALLTGEYSLDQIAHKVAPQSSTSNKHIHLTRSGVQLYITNTSQQQVFKNNRKNFERKPLQRRLVNVLAQHALHKADRESWALRKAAEYYFLRAERHGNIPLEKIVKLFEIYKAALDDGRQLGLERLGELAGIDSYPAVIGYLLKKVGLEPLNGTVKRHRVTKEKKEAILRSYGVEVPPSDIAYFLGLRAHVVSQGLRRKFGNTGNHLEYIETFGGRGGVLMYRTASQIYQAHDGGMSEDEIVYCFNGKQRMVNYALEHRQDIAPKIISLLNVLYPYVEHERLYL